MNLLNTTDNDLSYEAFINRRYFKCLDGVRALAILAVIWHHSLGLNPSDNPIFTRGYLGVDLFFALSGFLITTLLLREMDRSGTISLKQFYIRRTLRIFPVYYAFLLALFIWYGITDEKMYTQYLTELPYYALYITNWAPSESFDVFERGWSLAVEEQFYIIWPGALILLGFKRVGIITLLLIVCSLAISYSHLFEQLSYWVSHFIPFRTIFLGAILAFILHRKRTFKLAKIILEKSYTPFIILLVLVGVLSEAKGAINYAEQFLIHLLFVFFIGAIIVNEKSISAKIISNSLFSQIGVVSYGIYIFHGQFQGVTSSIVNLLPFQESKLAFFILFSLISTIVAMISFYTFESYFLRLKKNY